MIKRHWDSEGQVSLPLENRGSGDGAGWHDKVAHE
jgi:hypothetical protein